MFDDEVERVAQEIGIEPIEAKKLIEKDHKLVRFYLPPKTHWNEMVKQTSNLGEYLTDVVRRIAKENPKLQGVIDIVDFNATTAGQRVISNPFTLQIRVDDVEGRTI